ncbi:MAG: lipase maturation factor family protein [Elusimicrobia bacterium]|nr:lipase maturation factor family protein [Elusimicrobiota bacterium]
MKRPLLIFDGDCGFCRVWIERWRIATEGKVEYEPYQTAAARHKEVPREDYAEAVHLLERGRVSRGAEAVFRSLSYAPGFAWLPRVYAVPGISRVTELAYRFVAARRPQFSRLSRLLYGATPAPAPIARTTRLALAGIGLCYLLAFTSLGFQLRGLIGSNGVMPAAAWLDAARAQLGASRYWLIPTVAWFSASDAALAAYAWLGALASLGLIFGVATGPCAFVCWALYLSLSAIGADFMSFQWDVLLLEAGLIACVLGSWSLSARKISPSRGALWLLRLLLIKLMLQSGLVKLYSGDACWTDLTALTYHYWTQPLPTPLAWYANLLPLWAQKASCALMFAVELGAPLLLLLPRRPRAAGALAIAFLMLVIAATGNYGFFNLITIVLCLACLDDRFLNAPEAPPGALPSRMRTRMLGLLALASLTISFFETASIVGKMPPAPVRGLIAAVSPLRSFNRYGLFAVMTRTRDEIAVEVSADGHEWREWPFPYKPGDARRAPPWVAPHMPRLDWQMWFAALGEPGDSPWFNNLLVRLLQNDKDVQGLLGPHPLGGARPVYARAWRYETAFSTPEQKKADGSWWTRKRKGLFYPVITLKTN